MLAVPSWRAACTPPIYLSRVAPSSPIPPFMFKNYRRWRLSLGLLVAVALIGCGESESITTYETKRTAAPPQRVDIEKARDGLDHMLTAIVPQGKKAWFFKLVAPDDAIESLRKPFEEFVGSVKLGSDDARPSWTLPEGWEEKPGDAMRAATIEVPAGDRKLPLTISSLPLSGDLNDYVERNVTRWLDQLQQPPLPAGKAAQLARTMPIQGGEATVIELVGVMERTSGGMMPPGHPPVESTVTAGTPRTTGAGPTEPAGTAGPERPASKSPTAAQPSEFTYDTPAGWQPGPLSAMRKAAFAINDGSQQAEATVMPFPAGGPMSNPLAQAQRWAGQVELQLSEAELKSAEKPVTIDGLPGQQFELLGANGEGAKAILAAMVARDGQMWFFKMHGDRPLVEKQREAFAKFLESVKFNRGR